MKIKTGQAKVFHSELKTNSAPNHSVCFMMYNDTEAVRLFAYRYDQKTDLTGNGKLFSNLDKAKRYAFERGYIVKDETPPTQ